MSVIAPDAELRSPPAGRMVFRRAADLRVLLGPKVAMHPGVVLRALRNGARRSS